MTRLVDMVLVILKDANSVVVVLRLDVVHDFATTECVVSVSQTLLSHFNRI